MLSAYDGIGLRRPYETCTIWALRGEWEKLYDFIGNKN